MFDKGFKILRDFFREREVIVKILDPLEKIARRKKSGKGCLIKFFKTERV